MRETERGASSTASRTSGSVVGVGERISGGGLGGWDEEREDERRDDEGGEVEAIKPREIGLEQERERERVNEERRKGGGGGGGHWWSRKKKPEEVRGSGMLKGAAPVVAGGNAGLAR